MATKKRNIFAVALRWLWLAVNLLAALLTVVSAYGGMVSPLKVTLPSIVAMIFPLCILGMVLLGIINLFVRKRYVVIPIVALIVSMGAMREVCPLNVIKPKCENEERLRLMCYNTFGFIDVEECYPNNTNRTASQIIASGADIVCVQEEAGIYPLPKNHLHREQVDSINSIYPYCVNQRWRASCILSKYPLKAIDLPQYDSSSAAWSAAETVVNGDTILIVSLHLQSLGLSDADKEIYHKMTDIDREVDLESASKTLFRKLSPAFRQRAKQVEMLRHQLDSLNYRNVIVAGDFNEVGNGFALNYLAADNLKSAFSEVAFGPTITYHKDRFYFHIDHVLYGGCLTPLDFEVGNVKSSDHYPIIVNFALTSKE
ncbi:MAG: endonuclease/exonuclease/phosphatase family protein [Muribaculaceae bacterium]|nr:endonuclease/exonuclease/phosphatase family protein [Muribaculaceae bacterium]